MDTKSLHSLKQPCKNRALSYKATDNGTVIIGGKEFTSASEAEEYLLSIKRIDLPSRKPSDFTDHPMNSVFRSHEHEMVARNIMIILERLGDEWADIAWDQYKEQRLKDGNFSEAEKGLFEKVSGYCKSADTAVLFSDTWKSIT